MAKTGLQFNFMPYPEPDGQRSGCKVGWNYYKDEAKAKECAIAARHNGGIKERQGYDFGYQSPGAIDKVADNLYAKYAGMYCVTLP